jgi:hypothetical protein
MPAVDRVMKRLLSGRLSLLLPTRRTGSGEIDWFRIYFRNIWGIDRNHIGQIPDWERRSVCHANFHHQSEVLCKTIQGLNRSCFHPCLERPVPNLNLPVKNRMRQFRFAVDFFKGNRSEPFGASDAGMS